MKLRTSTTYITYLYVHSSIGGVMVKSDVIDLLFKRANCAQYNTVWYKYTQ